MATIHHGRSMEDEARHILRSAVAGDDAPRANLAGAIRKRFHPIGGVELRLPVRSKLEQ
ncbi:MAG: FitA-like ribbon-helix-helix domain-containing protein [Burkholderiales bacterium]